MRKSAKFAFILFMLLLLSSQVKADEEITSAVYFDRAGMKILTGAANITTGWMEFPKNIVLWRQKETNTFVGFIEGVLWGIVHTASRTGSGALDIATFWLPTFPSPNPPFIWDDFSQPSEYHGFRMGA